LGFPDGKSRNKPTKINGKYKEVICGYDHNFLIDLQSNYFAFGSNEYYQLFLKHENSVLNFQTTPIELILENIKIKKIFAGN